MTFVYTVLSLAVTGSILLLLLTALLPMLKKHLPQWAVHLLYVVIVLRLLIPFSPEFSVMHRAYHSGVEQMQIQQNNAETYRPDAHSSVLPQEITTGQAVPSQQTITSTPVQGSTADNAETGTEKSFPWTAILFWTWISGTVIMLTRTITGYVLFRKAIAKDSRPVVVDGFKELPVLVTSAVTSPMLVGIIRPMILLPDRDIPKWQLKDTLKHETAHYRRWDIPAKWAVELCCAIYWFNPLMPMLRRQMNESCERACDEYVVRDMSEKERKLYIRTLVEATASKNEVPNAYYPLATAMTSGASRLKERLEDAMNYRKTTKAHLLISLAAVGIFAAAGLLLGACAADTVPEDAPQVSSGDVTVPVTEKEPFAVMYFNVVEDGEVKTKEVLDYDIAAKAAALLTPDEYWLEHKKSGIDNIGNPKYDIILDNDEFGPREISIYGDWFFQTKFGSNDFDIYITYPSDDKFSLPEQKCYRMPEENHRQLMEMLDELAQTAPDVPECTAAELLELWANDPHLNLTIYDHDSESYYQTFPVRNEGGVDEILRIIGDTDEWTEISYEDYLASKPSSGAVLAGYPGGEEQLLISNGIQHVASVGTWDKKYYTTPNEIYLKLKEYTMENAVYISKVTGDGLSTLNADDTGTQPEYADIYAALEEVHRYRADNGLSILKLSRPSDGTGLYEASMMRLEEIKESFSHYRPDGKDYSVTYESFAAGGSDFTELLCAGPENAAQAVDMWLNVPEICERLLGDLTHMCLVTGKDDEGQTYWLLAAGKF